MKHDAVACGTDTACLKKREGARRTTSGNSSAQAQASP
jgi:hypothetical protein